MKAQALWWRCISWGVGLGVGAAWLWMRLGAPGYEAETGVPALLPSVMLGGPAGLAVGAGIGWLLTRDRPRK